MHKGYKIRIYPNKTQRQLIDDHINACRFLWNYMIDRQKERYASDGKYISFYDMNHLITELRSRSEYEWLSGVSFASLTRVCLNLDRAYKSFFNKKNGRVKYKTKKRSKPSYPVGCNCMYFIDGYVSIVKIGKIKYKTDFVFPTGKGHKFTEPCITYVDGKYILSFGMERDSQAHDLGDDVIGVDLGVKEFAVCAYGNKKFVYHNINKSVTVRKLEKKIRYLNSVLSRKYRLSRRDDTGRLIESHRAFCVRMKIRRLYRRLTNIRLNYIHQITHDIVSLLPRAVVIEDLDVVGMMKNKHLSTTIQSQCFYEFFRQIQYKCEWNNIPLIIADRYYPSSKMCSGCGCIRHNLSLSDRTYICDKCGLRIDRDYNAAPNLARYTIE